MEAWEFGSAVRRWRDAVDPDVVGLPVGGRRRAPGLRREELAALSGISVDYLTRLEQGRATAPSEQVVEALARGLRLTDGERDLLFRLAGRTVPGAGMVPSRLPASIQRLLDRLDGVPAVVYDAAWNLVVANQAYDALMGPTAHLQGRERNAVWRNLVGSGSRARLTARERSGQVERLVADLRATVGAYPHDTRLRRLVDELAAESEEFRMLWPTAIATAAEPSRHKVIDHPVVGAIAVDCDTLVVVPEDLRIMVYTAEPGTADAERLRLALVVGTQSLATEQRTQASDAAGVQPGDERRQREVGDRGVRRP